MFETSVVREHTAAAPRRTRVLSVSLAAHAVVVVGAMAVGIASVDFPTSAPNQFQLFQQVAAVSVPPPLGDPNGGAKPAAKPEPQKPAPAPVPNQPTAPSVVPDDVTPAASSSTSTATGPESDGPPGTGTSTAPLGVPWGDPNSVGTDLDVPPAVSTPAAVEDKIYTVTGDVKAPVVIHRVEPKFPPALARIRMNATIRVRCIIDKHGNVRDPQVLVSSLPPFNQSVLAAVEQWRFQPATLHGQAIDAWFELTVNFAVR